MPGWTVTEIHPIHGRTFERPLSGSERGFFWNGRCDGIGDSLHHIELRLSNPSLDEYLFGEANIVKAWLSTKRRHPLAGATVQVSLGAQTARGPLEMADSKAENGGHTISTFAPDTNFVIREHDLAVLRPNEIVIKQVACAEDMERQITEILDGPRPLSEKLLAQLYVFRETNPHRRDVLHMMTLIPHCVTDGTANRSFMRCLLDTLARGGEPDSEPVQIPLEERLAMVIPSADLEPVHLRSLSPSRRRWRTVVAAVILQLRKAKGQGGHTLPRRYTRATPHTPARSGFVSTLVTEAQTNTVLTSCRRYGLTFGNAYVALAQVAMTRVLYRRYLRGEISEEEWAYRKRQPYRSFCPLNLRPYLEKEWFEKGGGGEFVVSISAFCSQLPFMTLGVTERRKRHEHELSDGAPPFSDLLTFDRFLHRARLAQKQTRAFLNHPLFTDIIRVASSEFGRNTHLSALEWRKRVGAASGVGTHGSLDNDNGLPVVLPSVVAHRGSTLGNMHLVFPTEYPLPPSHPLSPFSPVPHPSRAGYVTPPVMKVNTTPRIVVENAMTRLHTLPAELYLGALTLRGQLRMYIFYDRNVYEDGVVKEWLDEVRGAVLWYLGQIHQSRGNQRGDD